MWLHQWPSYTFTMCCFFCSPNTNLLTLQFLPSHQCYPFKKVCIIDNHVCRWWLSPILTVSHEYDVKRGTLGPLTVRLKMVFPQGETLTELANISIHYILAPNTWHPNPCLAIDITIPCAPKLPSQQTQTSLPAPSGFPNANSTSTPLFHKESALRKICIAHAQALLAHGVSILHFTINHLGGLGSFASTFLYGTPLSCKIQPAEPPPNWTPNTS